MNRNVLLAILAAIVLLLVLLMTGVIDLDSDGGALPDVDVSATGGEMPDIDADVADIDVGSKEVTAEVPTLEVNEADASAE